jgi:GAF domain-containing protein
MVPAQNSQAASVEMMPEDTLVALSRLLKALRACQTAQDAMTMVLDNVHQTFEFEVAWLGMYDRINHQLITRGCHSPPHLRSIRTVLPLTPGDVMEQVVIQQRPLIIADLQNEIRSGEWGGIAKQLSLQSALIFPIKRQDTCFGLVVLASSQWGITPSLGDRAYLSILLGNLADRIDHEEAAQQRLQTKRFEQPFFTLLGRLNTSTTIDSQLVEVVREAQRFIAPNRVRVFWFEPRGNYFWQRVPVKSPRFRPGQPTAPPEDAPRQEDHIAVDDIRGLYQLLCSEHLVVVGESRGALKAVISERLVQHLNAQAMMLAPILDEGGDLLGFISAESASPRIWKESEKQFLTAAAQLLGLALPVAAHKETLHQLKLDQHLTAGVIQGMYGDGDWHQTLAACGKALEERFAIRQFLVLLFNTDRNGYELCFQHQAGHPSTVPLFWPCLDDVDWQMLERSQTPIAVDNIHHTLKLTVWRSLFLKIGIQSALVCNVSPGNAPEGILIITDSDSRQWTVPEQQLFTALGQQVGVILHQWQLQRRLDQQKHIYDSIQWGLHALHKRFHADQLEQTTVRQILQLLQASTVLLLSWEPGGTTARVTHMAQQDNSVWVNEDYPIAVHTDAIINWAMQTDGILPLTAQELPADTADWFAAAPNSRILVTALRTAPEHCVYSTIVVVSTTNHPWSDYQLSILKLLTNQLAWSRRHLRLVSLLHQQRQELETLNWYKHHRLEDCFRGLLKVARGVAEKQQASTALTVEQQQQLLDQIKTMVDSLDGVLNQEEWYIQHGQQTMPLISLINRLMERLDPLLESRQLWSKVHNESSLILGGDMAKLEMIIYDVMAAACQRSPMRGRIDIWCRTINQDWFELSITDDGQVAPDLLEELKLGQPQDLLAPSLLDIPPGLRLSICQSLIRQLGGDVTISVLDDGRTLSRFLLPRATHIDARKPSPLPTFDGATPDLDPNNPN